MIGGGAGGWDDDDGVDYSYVDSVITEEQAQERSDRAALIPWVKFLWESYTQCLDLLRNNARLENLYHDIAQMVGGGALKD
jgi:translation initiation factor 3 subunit A